MPPKNVINVNKKENKWNKRQRRTNQLNGVQVFFIYQLLEEHDFFYLFIYFELSVVRGTR